MTHLHKRSGHTFEVGSYISPDDNKTYDITVISYWKDPEQETIGPPVELIGFYFGDYNERDTDFYIDQWLDNRVTEISTLDAAKHYMNAYLITNEDALEQEEIARLERAIGDCENLLYDRSWKFEFKKHTTTRSEYIRQLEELHADGKIDCDAMDTLYKLAVNYPA